MPLPSLFQGVGRWITAKAVVAYTEAGQPALGDVTATGVISIINSVPAGIASANSAVEIAVDGRTTLGIQVTGAGTGALSVQATIKGDVWVTLSALSLMNSATGALISVIPSATPGLYQLDVSGFSKVRVTALAAVTSNYTVDLRLSAGTSMLALDTPLPAGSASIGNLGTVATVTTVGAVTGITNGVAVAPSVSVGGYTIPYTLISLATTNATLVRAGAGNVGFISLQNTSAAIKYVKLFNKATAPVPGTDTPVQNLAIPIGGIVVLPITAGLRFSLGIGLAITGAAALLDATAVAAGDVIVNMHYV